jgi:hypothetical protein
VIVVRYKQGSSCAGLQNQSCDVVLVKGALVGKTTRGRGSEWETDGGQMESRWVGMEMKRSVYKQHGTRVDGSYHSKEGFQVSKGDSEREQKGLSKGRQKARGKRQCI